MITLLRGIKAFLFILYSCAFKDFLHTWAFQKREFGQTFVHVYKYFSFVEIGALYQI